MTAQARPHSPCHGVVAPAPIPPSARGVRLSIRCSHNDHRECRRGCNHGGHIHAGLENDHRGNDEWISGSPRVTRDRAEPVVFGPTQGLGTHATTAVANGDSWRSHLLFPSIARPWPTPLPRPHPQSVTSALRVDDELWARAERKNGPKAATPSQAPPTPLHPNPTQHAHLSPDRRRGRACCRECGTAAAAAALREDNYSAKPGGVASWLSEVVMLVWSRGGCCARAPDCAGPPGAGQRTSAPWPGWPEAGTHWC